jgi:hypothetical protein
METKSTCVSVTPLDNVVGMQQNIANPVRCIVIVNIKHTLQKKKKLISNIEAVRSTKVGNT